MKIIDGFYLPGTIDCWTFVTDDVDLLTGYRTMLAVDETGAAFSQFTEGMYEEGGDNSHLGERPRLMNERLLNHILDRMSHE